VFIIYKEKIVDAGSMVSARYASIDWGKKTPIIGKVAVDGWKTAEITDKSQLTANFHTMFKITKEEKLGFDVYFETEDLSDEQKEQKQQAIDLIAELGLSDDKVDAVQEINNVVAIVRKKLITQLEGQKEIYREKADEATDYVASGHPEDLSNFPFIRAEAQSRGITPKEASGLILEARGVWVSKSSLIEEYRVFGKINVNKSVDSREIIEIKNKTISNLNNV